jgi:hypothetical protein
MGDGKRWEMGDGRWRWDGSKRCKIQETSMKGLGRGVAAAAERIIA